MSLKHKNIKKFWKISLIIFSVILLSGVIFVYTQLDINSWQNFDPEKISNLQESTLIYDNRGQLVTSIHGIENRRKVSIYEVPEHVKYAFVAAEDARFYEHPGFDVVRIFGALVSDIKTLSLREGASTITQQLIKLSMLTSDKKISRKLQEAVLAFQLERRYTKDAILEMYLNIIYFGRGAYGIEAASEAFFGKKASELTLVEGATLAASIKAPSNYAPHIKPENNKRRRDMILSNMAELGYITEEQCAAAKSMPLEIIAGVGESEVFQHGWFMDEAIAEAERILGITSEELLSGGYRIYTTMDTYLQESAEVLFTDNSNFQPPAADGVASEAALVAMDTGNGGVLALIGGREYTVRRGLNRATQTRRQPGSALKPISVYAPAIDRFHYTPATLINDERTDFSGYSPRNFGGKYNGIVTTRTALAKSLNVPAVKILNDIGVPTSRDYMKKAGLPLSDNDANLAIALGALTDGVTPTELCAAYVPLSNGGNYYTPHTISHIYSSDNTLIYAFSEPAKQIIRPESAYVVTNMLKSVITSGTGSRLSGIQVPLAGKTGTVDYEEIGNRDGWMVAYTPNLAVTVWMGFDKTDSTHYLDNSLTGGGLPAELAGKLVSKAYEGVTANKGEKLEGFRSRLLWRGEELSDFIRPKGVVDITLDRVALEENHELVLATAFTPKEQTLTEVFTKGSEPTKTGDYWQIPGKVTDLTVSANDEGYPVITFTGPQKQAAYRLYRRTGGADIVIAEHQGAGRVMVTDRSVDLSRLSVYYVVPVHIELEKRGQNATGPASAQVAFDPSLLFPNAPDSDDFGLDDFFNSEASDSDTSDLDDSDPEDFEITAPEPSPDTLDLIPSQSQ